jgi:hypothetical protein
MVFDFPEPKGGAAVYSEFADSEKPIGRERMRE